MYLQCTKCQKTIDETEASILEVSELDDCPFCDEGALVKLEEEDNE